MIEESEGDHEDGDGCAIYLTGYRVITPDGQSDVEDLEVGDLFRDEAYECEGEWREVEDIALVDDDVHVDCGELLDDDEMEVAA